MDGGFGVILKIDVSSVLTAVAFLQDVDFPEFEKFLAEMTHHQSTGGYAEYVDTGKRKLNEFPATLGWDISDSTHAAIVAAFDSTSPVDMSIEDPNSTEVIAFSAHIRKLGRISKQEDGYKCDITIQPTGGPTIT